MMTMRAVERREVRLALAANQAGDRARANEILRALLRDSQQAKTMSDGSHQIIFGFVRFYCEKLHEESVSASVCVARQLASEEQRTADTWRGQSSDFPSCVSQSCVLGRTIRERLGSLDLALCLRMAKRSKRNRFLVVKE